MTCLACYYALNVPLKQQESGPHEFITISFAICIKCTYLSNAKDDFDSGSRTEIQQDTKNTDMTTRMTWRISRDEASNLFHMVPPIVSTPVTRRLINFQSLISIPSNQSSVPRSPTTRLRHHEPPTSHLELECAQVRPWSICPSTELGKLMQRAGLQDVRR